MWPVLVFGGIIVLTLGLCWTAAIDNTWDWDPEESYDFWMIDDSQD